jgi:hypothetical protein
VRYSRGEVEGITRVGVLSGETPRVEKERELGLGEDEEMDSGGSAAKTTKPHGVGLRGVLRRSLRAIAQEVRGS